MAQGEFGETCAGQLRRRRRRESCLRHESIVRLLPMMRRRRTANCNGGRRNGRGRPNDGLVSSSPLSLPAASAIESDQKREQKRKRFGPAGDEPAIPMSVTLRHVTLCYVNIIIIAGSIIADAITIIIMAIIIIIRRRDYFHFSPTDGREAQPISSQSSLIAASRSAERLHRTNPFELAAGHVDMAGWRRSHNTQHTSD